MYHLLNTAVITGNAFYKTFANYAWQPVDNETRILALILSGTRTLKHRQTNRTRAASISILFHEIAKEATEPDLLRND